MMLAATWRVILTVILSVLIAAAGVSSLAASEPDAAGVVVQYGDGSRVYAYVQFSQESITSEELLTRTGLDVVMAAFGGMGAAVCSIDGEGCPSSNCWCQSFSHPAFFWHFYALQDGRWVEQLRGASARQIRDGDVDGWLWTAGDTSLPPISFDEIAAASGVEVDATGVTPELDPSISVIFVSAGESVRAATDNGSLTNYLLFAGMLAGVLALATVIVARHRMNGAPVSESADE